MCAEGKPLHEDDVIPLAVLIHGLCAKIISPSSPVGALDWSKVLQLVEVAAASLNKQSKRAAGLQKWYEQTAQQVCTLSPPDGYASAPAHRVGS